MTVILLPVRDLSHHQNTPPSLDGTGVWLSNGDDPSFLVRKNTRREEFLVLTMSSHGAAMDPKFYVRRGLRYREEDATVLPEHTDFILVIGCPAGPQRQSLRFDPCSFTGSFSLSCEQVEDQTMVEAVVRENLKKTPRARVEYISWSGGSIIKRWISGWIGGLLKSDIRAHSTRLYRRAEEELASVVAEQDSGTWLSVVVPIYNTPIKYLEDIVCSYGRQEIDGTELILSDDGSAAPEMLAWLEQLESQGLTHVKVLKATNNGGISAATNLGVSSAKGQWIALLDHDDVIAPAAFKSIYRAILENQHAKFIYTDTLLVKENLTPRRYILKPAYDPVMLSGMNYINHFSIFRRDVVALTGEFHSNLDGSQDYDFLLRYLKNVRESEILHLPYPAYWWRRHKNSFSKRHMKVATQHARQALVTHFSQSGSNVEVTHANTPMFHRVLFRKDPTLLPKISIIIPNRNSYTLVRSLLSDLYEKTDYPRFEVIIIDNGTTDQRVVDLYRQYQLDHSNFSYSITKEEFNFSRSVNKGCAAATGDMYLLLNNDVEVIHDDWLTEMVSCFEFENVGIVGAKLLYPNDRIQHAGVVVGFGGLAGHWYHGRPRQYGGHTNRLHVRTSMTCVTAAVMLISRRCAETVGLWDEANFAVAYNDVDYCVRAFNSGFRVVWTPFACLYHHESVSRGSDRSPSNRARFEREKANLKRLHGTGVFADPASNPFFTVNSSEPRLRHCGTLPRARTWFAQNADHSNGCDTARGEDVVDD